MQLNNEPVLERLVRIETMLETVIRRHESHLNDHEERIRLLEKAKWPLPSVAVVVSLISLMVMIWKQFLGG